MNPNVTKTLTKTGIATCSLVLLFVLPSFNLTIRESIGFAMSLMSLYAFLDKRIPSAFMILLLAIMLMLTTAVSTPVFVIPAVILLSFSGKTTTTNNQLTS